MKAKKAQVKPEELIVNELIEAHAAYLESWCPMLRKDPKILFKSLANASKAAEMIIGEQ